MHASASPSRLRVAYGIDRSANALAIARCARSRRGMTCEVLLDEEGDGAAIADPALEPAVARAAARGRAARVAALSAEASFTRRLRAPFASRRKARRVFPSLLDIQLPFPLDQCVYDFLDIRRTETAQVETLAVAARITDLTARLAQLGEMRIDPEHLVHEGLALWNLSLQEMPVETETHRVVVCLGHDHATFVSGLGTSLVSCHCARTGWRALKAGPDGTPAEGLRIFVRRAQQVLHTAGPAGPDAPLQWCWAGPGAEQPGLLEALQQELGDHSVRFFSHHEPAGFLARALGFAALNLNAEQFNFRQGRFAHPGVVRRQARVRRTTRLVALVTGLALLAGSVLWNAWIEKHKAGLQQALSNRAITLTGLSSVPRGQEVEMVRRAFAARAEQTAPLARAFEPSLTGDMLAILESAAAGQLWLDTLTLRDDAVVVRGTGGDWDRCARMEETLEQIGYAVKADVAEARADERVHFNMQGQRL